MPKTSQNEKFEQTRKPCLFLANGRQPSNLRAPVKEADKNG